MVCGGCIFNHAVYKPRNKTGWGLPCKIRFAVPRKCIWMVCQYQTGPALNQQITKNHDRNWDCLRPTVFAWTFQDISGLDMEPPTFPWSIEGKTWKNSIIFSKHRQMGPKLGDRKKSLGSWAPAGDPNWPKVVLSRGWNEFIPEWM